MTFRRHQRPASNFNNCLNFNILLYGEHIDEWQYYADSIRSASRIASALISICFQLLHAEDIFGASATPIKQLVMDDCFRADIDMRFSAIIPLAAYFLRRDVSRRHLLQDTRISIYLLRL